MSINIGRDGDTSPNPETAVDEARGKPQDQTTAPKLRAGFDGAVRKCVEIVPTLGEGDDDGDHGPGYGGDRCM